MAFGLQRALLRCVIVRAKEAGRPVDYPDLSPDWAKRTPMVIPPTPQMISASPVGFEWQMAYIRRHFTVLSLEEIIERFRVGSSLPLISPRSLSMMAIMTIIPWPILSCSASIYRQQSS